MFDPQMWHFIWNFYRRMYREVFWGKRMGKLLLAANLVELHPVGSCNIDVVASCATNVRTLLFTKTHMRTEHEQNWQRRKQHSMLQSLNGRLPRHWQSQLLGDSLQDWHGNCKMHDAQCDTRLKETATHAAVNLCCNQCDNQFASDREAAKQDSVWSINFST